MERIENPELNRKILNHLADLYKIKEKREGIHLSTLVGCLTRSYLDSQQVIEPTDEEVMFFSVGYGLQDVMTPKDATTPVYEKDGITYRPDMIFKVAGGENLVEIKTTRMSYKRLIDGLSESWVEYIQGGCYIRSVTAYDLAVLLIIPAISHSETLKFTTEELLGNWGYILTRRDVYKEALETKEVPTPYEHCKDWECKNCRYKLMCETITIHNRAEEGKKLWD